MKSHVKKLLGMMCLLGVVIANIQCSNTPTASGKQTGNLKIWLTDKPFPFDLIEEANVTITKIEIRCAGDDDDDDVEVACEANEDCDDGLFCNGEETCVEEVCTAGVEACDGETCDEETDTCLQSDDNGNDDGDPDDNSCPFIEVFSGERTFNLLNLQNGETDLLVDLDVPSGMYTQMRVYVTEGQIILKEGAGEFTLKVPSGAQSGIKLNFDFEVGGEGTGLLLDFDLSRAFKPIPGSAVSSPEDIREFKFSPSLAMRVTDVSETGNIAGTVTFDNGGVTTPLENVSVTVYLADVEVTSTATEADGTYMLMGLEPGSYRVDFSATGYLDASVDSVNVNAGEDTIGVDAVMNPE